MSLFQRKKKRERGQLGKGADETVTLRKEIEVLNYTPLDYKLTMNYAEFRNRAEAYFQKVINNTSPDDLSGDMFDAYIDANIMQMKGSAKEQNIHHVQVIRHHKQMLDGELVCCNANLNHLREDLQEINKEIDRYQKIKEDKGIVC